MTYLASSKIKFAVCILFSFISSLMFSQEYQLDSASTLSVYGTSSLHDWHITTTSYSGSISFTNVNTGEIKTCNVTIPTETLKSGKSAMDKNTYKALQTNKYKNISFTLTKADNATVTSEGNFSIKATGNLTIAGTKKLITLNLNVIASQNQIKLTGEKTFKMSEFNIEPPTALFGTVTTGDEITIKFNSIFK
ncbi:YceI family protein [Neotamlana laminarinivorans]|uniref:YceI family protein n=1 Tax=Neotamlana laminarinivorans TaxID=2883124 RepID=A0A9X1HZ40_9FLAO|nr:YceI family protein [Tamlana laminarinivorans]MCB4797960.1 YceI family protein [Tamlana laminarinivorans]